MSPVLRMSHVRKVFRNDVVLRDLSLEVAEHEVVVLIGASGSGKSTLLRCINLLETIDDGTIHLDGVDISAPGVDADGIRKKIGLVFQSFNLFPHLSVLDNVTLAPRRVHGLGRAAAEAAAMAWLERVGLAGRARDYPDRLSGGQQQRVAIVRSLVNAPRLMLLDEVTSALDPELVGEVLALIRSLKAEGGWAQRAGGREIHSMTMLIATHEMGFARQVADRVCFLHNGQILEQGPPERVLGDPREPRTRQFLRLMESSGRLGG